MIDLSPVDCSKSTFLLTRVLVAKTTYYSSYYNIYNIYLIKFTKLSPNITTLVQTKSTIFVIIILFI